MQTCEGGAVWLASGFDCAEDGQTLCVNDLRRSTSVCIWVFSASPTRSMLT